MEKRVALNCLFEGMQSADRGLSCPETSNEIRGGTYFWFIKYL